MGGILMLSKKIISSCCLSLVLLASVSAVSPTIAFAQSKNEIQSSTVSVQGELDEALIQKASHNM
jgi:hypothetical protein